MKKWIVAAIALGISPVAQAGKHVDIGDPRALDALQAENPARYEKVMGILEVASRVECETLPRMLKVQYGADSVRCSGALILTSYPAKRRLSFKLENMAFSGNVALTGAPSKLTPAIRP
ncbi:MAG TPA: hypothetical protein VM051_01170 [Usitatibacter sp.]|nr:hypothetical protein [Usitatibacter sp.]